MNALISNSKSEKPVLGLISLASALMVVLFATVALGDAIDDGLPANTPAAVKASTRQAVQSGMESGSVIKLTRAMQQNKFNVQQIQLTHALIIEAQNSRMPVQPLMNKAFEGMAKNVPPPLIVNALEMVQSRNAFAFQRASKLSSDKSRTHNLGRTLAAGLAAGLTEADADKITKMAQQRAGSMNSDKAYSLALECYQTARDVSRLGVSSQAATGLVTQALNKGFNPEDMRAMRNSFMMQAQHSEPQNLARGYAAAIQEGKGFQKGPGAAGGQSGGPGPGGGGGAGSGGSGSGGSGGSGAGSGGSGSGGAGAGSGGSGSGGDSGSGSGGSGSGSGGSGAGSGSGGAGAGSGGSGGSGSSGGAGAGSGGSGGSGAGSGGGGGNP